MQPNVTPDAPRELYFQRTPFQLAILTFCTFGIYPLFWVIRARRFAERRLERDVTSYWFYFTLLIPIYGLIVFFESYSTGQRRVTASSVRPAAPFWLSALGIVVMGLLWRLPGSYFTLSF